MWNQPAVTGKLTSKKTFSAFVNITIRAKLPKGDYVYPGMNKLVSFMDCLEPGL